MTNGTKYLRAINGQIQVLEAEGLDVSEIKKFITYIEEGDEELRGKRWATILGVIATAMVAVDLEFFLRSFLPNVILNANALGEVPGMAVYVNGETETLVLEKKEEVTA